MKSYKGYEYPEIKELWGDKDKYSKDDDHWVITLCNIDVLVDKSAGQKELDEIIENFVDVQIDNIMKVNRAKLDLDTDIQNKSAALHREVDTSHIDGSFFDTVEFTVSGETEEEIEDNIKDLQNKIIDEQALVDEEKLKESTEEVKEENLLTDEQVEKIAEAMEEVKESSEELKAVSELPSNNGQTEVPEENRGQGEKKIMEVTVDSDTGEHIVRGYAEPELLKGDETFEDMLERIKDEEFDASAPIDEDMELPPVSASFGSLIGDEKEDLTNDEIKALIKLANRRIAKEEFNVFKAYPERVQKLINRYVSDTVNGAPMHSTKVNTLRNSISEKLLDDFILNVNLERVKSDFSKEVENIFSKGVEGISQDIVGYTDEKIQAYREKVDKIEDPEKKEKLQKVLEAIDKGYSLEDLAEFAKKCKIKKFDLEKPGKIFDRYNGKFKESTYDTYSIEMCLKTLSRHLMDEASYNDLVAFMICYCKFVTNYDPKDVINHAFMYYVTYNIILMDINISADTKHVSEKYKQNILQVIKNLKERNKESL